MTWLNVCQWMLVTAFALRFLAGIYRALNGSAKTDPTGTFGVFVILVYFFFAGLVLWRAGGLSTVLGAP